MALLALCLNLLAQPNYNYEIPGPYDDYPGTYHIRTFINFIRPSDQGWTTGWDLQEQANIAMATLNAAYNKHGIYFVPYADPCSQDATFQPHNTTLSVSDIRTQLPQAVHGDALDIYVTTDNGPPSGNEYFTPNNYCQVWGQDNSVLVVATEVLVHEVGHNLGLVHTFISGATGGCNETTGVCGIEAPCTCCGDYVCDTQFHTDDDISANSSDCSHGSLPEHIVRNFMSYTTPGDCRDRFTPEQVKRMRTYLEQVPVLQAMQIKTTLPGGTLGSVSGSITVESGTQTISSSLAMLPNAVIRVKPGAKLRVMETITGACDQMWQGVVVEGNSTDADQETDEQGQVEMYGAGTIEHARCGIDVQNTNYADSAQGGGGGIVNIYAGHLIDNTIGIRFGPYTGSGHNKSRLILADFATTDDYRGVDAVPTHLKMTDVAKVPVHFCDFRDLRTDCEGPHTRATGIDAKNSGLSVLSGDFEGLRIGLRTDQLTENNGSFNIVDCDFAGCYRGIATLSSGSFSIFANDFLVKRPEACSELAIEAIGVKIEGNTAGFKFTGNDFSFDDFTLPLETLIGTDCYGLKDGMGNTILDNTYYILHIGNRASGDNGYEDDGLLYLCNQNDLINLADFDVPSGSVRKIQGDQSDVGPIAPTGNTFSPTPAKGFNNLGGFTVDYYFYENDDLHDPEYGDGSEGIIEHAVNEANENCGEPDPCPPPCPDEEEVERWKSDFHENRAEWLDKKAGLPYITNQLELEQELAAIRLLRLAMNRDGNRVLMQFSLDSTALWTDSIIAWLHLIETYPTDLRLARHYFFTGQTAGFSDLWEDLPARYDLVGDALDEYEALDDVYGLLDSYVQAGTLDRLPEEVADDLKDRAEYCDEAGFLARAVLWRNGIDVETECPSAEERAGKNKAGKAPGNNALFRLYPNPATHHLQATYLPLTAEGRLRLFNSQGVLLQQIPLPLYSTTSSIPIGSLYPGIYFVEWYDGGHTVEAIRLIISR